MTSSIGRSVSDETIMRFMSLPLPIHAVGNDASNSSSGLGHNHDVNASDEEPVVPPIHLSPHEHQNDAAETMSSSDVALDGDDDDHDHSDRDDHDGNAAAALVSAVITTGTSGNEGTTAAPTLASDQLFRRISRIASLLPLPPQGLSDGGGGAPLGLQPAFPDIRKDELKALIELVLFPIRLGKALNSWDFDELTNLLVRYCDRDVVFTIHRLQLRGINELLEFYRKVFTEACPDSSMVMSRSTLAYDPLTGERVVVFRSNYVGTRVKPGDERYNVIYAPPEGRDEVEDLDVSRLSLQEVEEKRAVIVERVIEQKSGYAVQTRGWTRIAFNKEYKIVSYRLVYEMIHLEPVNLTQYSSSKVAPTKPTATST
jgi:hypothetical protein